jgi:C4-dicarboxylate-specific signal transduction histidine kinase
MTGTGTEAALDRVLTGLCHSMNDRLAGLHGLLYVAWKDGAVGHREYEALRDELERLGGLVHVTRLLAQSGLEVEEPVLLTDMVDEVLQLLAHTDDAPAAPLLAGSPPPVRARRSALRRLLLELVSARGAVVWSQAAGELRLSLPQTGDEAARSAAVEAAGGRLEHDGESAVLVLRTLS